MLWIDEPRLEHERVRDHRVVLRVGVLLDVEVLLDGAVRVREEGPLGADRRAELLERVVVVGRDRGDLRVGDRDLRIERGELKVLLVLLRAVVAAREREDQRVVALQLAEPRGRCSCDRGAGSRGRRRRARCPNAYRAPSVVSRRRVARRCYCGTSSLGRARNPLDTVSFTGRGAAWLARQSGGLEVPSSNLGAPTYESFTLRPLRLVRGRPILEMGQ